ncbi:Nup85 nucleoporin-domain-containing protein [Limtongia smithiae]|uniref:Nup85 nucleoporin-domain-containing protein n=1 Tax=Limtongia smithiae TaxID=1125753 RepID=UPI0034CF209E
MINLSTPKSKSEKPQSFTPSSGGQRPVFSSQPQLTSQPLTPLPAFGSSSSFSFGQPLRTSSAPGFGFDASANTSAATDADGDAYEDEDEGLSDNEDEECMTDAPIARGSMETFKRRQRTLKYALAPLCTEGIAWIDTKGSTASVASILEEELKVYPCEIPYSISTPEYNAFVEESHQLFTRLSSAAMSTSYGQNILPQYATQFLQIVDSWRRRINDAQLDAAYSICCCLFACFFPDPAVTRAEAVMGWLNQDNPRPTMEETSDIMRSRKPAEEPGFWDFIYKLAMRGLFLQCSNSLQQAGIVKLDAEARSVLQQAITVLETAPKGAERLQEYRNWRARAISFGDAATHLIEPTLRKSLTTLSSILRGDTDTILALAESWQEATAALFLLHDPSPKRLAEYFETATDTFPVDTTTLADTGCAAVISSDIVKALSIVLPLDACVAAHMGDFCDRQRMLDDFYNIDTLDLPSFRDYLFLSHGEICCMRSGLWFVGVAYLKEVEAREGVAIIKQTISHVYIDSSQTLANLMEVCKELNLIEEREQIVMAWGKLQLAAKNAGSALQWLNEIGNAMEIRNTAWRLLENSLLRGISVPDPILSNYLASPQLCPDLIREFIAPYAIYYTYRTQLAEQNFEDAARNLASLISFPFLPGKFLGVLLAELVRFIGHREGSSGQSPLLLSTPELGGILTSLYRWEKDAAKVKSGMEFLDTALALSREAKPQFAPDDWRHGFPTQTASEVVAIARNRLVKGISRAYLEEA